MLMKFSLVKITTIVATILALHSSMMDRPVMAQSYLVSGTAEAPLRGAYEVTLTATSGITNGFLQNDLQVTFTRNDVNGRSPRIESDLRRRQHREKGETVAALAPG